MYSCTLVCFYCAYLFFQQLLQTWWYWKSCLEYWIIKLFWTKAKFLKLAYFIDLQLYFWMSFKTVFLYFSEQEKTYPENKESLTVHSPLSAKIWREKFSFSVRICQKSRSKLNAGLGICKLLKENVDLSSWVILVHLSLTLTGSVEENYL